MSYLKLTVNHHSPGELSDLSIKALYTLKKSLERNHETKARDFISFKSIFNRKYRSTIKNEMAFIEDKLLSIDRAIQERLKPRQCPVSFACHTFCRVCPEL